jgi:hypothetical protein
MLGYEIASTETAQLLLDQGSRRGPSVATPGGVVHAIDPEITQETLCGVATDSMRLWRLPWCAGENFNECPECVIATTVVSR